MSEKLGILYGVGVGPGDPGLLTLRAAEVLRSVDVIFHVVGPRSRSSVSERVVTELGDCKGRREELVFSMANEPETRLASVREAARKVADALERGEHCAFATIGDPLIYSTFSYLQREVSRLLPALAVRVIPGITAFQAAAAQWGEPLVEDNEVLSIIPKWGDDEGRRAVIDAADTAVILKSYRNRNEALATMQSRMAPDHLLYAARLGLADQFLSSDAAEVIEKDIEYLSLLIAKRGTRD